MSADSAVFWSFVVAWAIVLGAIIFVVLPQMVREIRRIIKHIVDLIETSPLPKSLADADAGLERINAAFDELPRLSDRASAAFLRLRSTPAVRLRLTSAVDRARAELDAFAHNAGPIRRR